MGNAKDYFVVFLIRLIYAGMQILSKAAFNQGMSTTVFVFYRQLGATLFLMPIAFVLERNRAPPLPYKVAFKLFIHSLYGIAAAMNISCIGIDYTSANSASALYSSMPVISFTFAVLFRMETLKLRKLHGIVKASGIALCVAGVMMLAFYDGPGFKSFNQHHLLGQVSSHTHGGSTNSKRKWVLGVFLITMATSSWSLWTVLQGFMLKQYPSKLLNTTLQCLFSTIQSFFIALVTERDFSRWKLHMDVSLVSVIYCGVIVSGVACYLQAWAIQRRGPVFLSMSQPLSLIMTMILSSVLLGEEIKLGSILGGILMTGGLYNVLWGKSKEIASKKLTSNEGNACMEEKEITVPVQTTKEETKFQIILDEEK